MAHTQKILELVWLYDSKSNIKFIFSKCKKVSVSKT